MREKIIPEAQLSAPNRRETEAFGALIAQIDQLRPEFVEVERAAKAALALRRPSLTDPSTRLFHAGGLWQKAVFASLAVLMLSLPLARLADPEARTPQTPSTLATRTSSAASNDRLGQEFTAASDQLFDPYASDWPAPSTSSQN